MDYPRATLFVAAAFLLGMSPAAADDAVKDVVICAATEMYACGLHEGCRKLHPGEINAPDFLKIDLKKMELTGRRYDGSYGTLKIDKKTRLPKLLLLQGVNAEPQELVDGLAYSLAIHVDTGRLSASVSTTETVYSLLGTCHAL